MGAGRGALPRVRGAARPGRAAHRGAPRSESATLAEMTAPRRTGKVAAMAQPSAELIRGIPIFADLDDASVTQLASDFIEREFEPGQAIATEGEGGLNFFVVESGTADVSVGGKGVGDARARRLVRGDRARRQVRALGDRHRDVAAAGLRAAGVELPELRRVPPDRDLEAARAAGRASPRRRAPVDSGTRWTPRRTPSSSPAAGRVTRRRGRRSSTGTRATSTRSWRASTASAPTTPRTSSRRCSRGSSSGSTRCGTATRSGRGSPRRRGTAPSTRFAAPGGRCRSTRCPRSIDEGLARLDEALTVHAALERLSADCHEILDRFFCRDESYRTISAELELPVGHRSRAGSPGASRGCAIVLEPGRKPAAYLRRVEKVEERR